jgi:glycosyltransferase involved in cell wall biosynthesis
MQILAASYEYPPLGGGGAKVVSGISRRLAARGHIVDVLTMDFRGLPAKEISAGVNIRRVPGIRLLLSSCSAAEMIPYVLLAPFFVGRKRAQRYIINHTHFIYPGGLIAYMLKRLLGLPYVITAHGSDVPNFNPNRFRLLHKILLPIWRRIARDASLVICPSKAIENLIRASSSVVRTRVIPNAIDTEKFRPRAKDARRLLVVTRMFERKGVQYVLKALAGVAERYSVDIVGDGPYLSTLKSLAEELHLDVRFWGHLDNDSSELKDLYETASIFVFTSESENFPMVLLEAMIAGTAIVTTEGTGCAEVVGDSALLVPVRDANAIRDAIDRLAKDPALVARLGRAARERVVNNFGWEGVIDQHLRVYEEFGRSPAPAVAAPPARPARRTQTQSLRIICPTYWYPGSADDTQAVYVHDINRHLVLHGHKVCVVAPGKPGAAERETFDGVEVVRFPFELPEDLTYGRVAQSKVSTMGRINRVVTMARYMAAQYRHTVIEGRRFGAQIVHGHWAIPTGPALVASAMRLGIPSVITLHGGDVYVNVAEGYDFPTRWYIRPILAWTLRKANALTAISEDCKMHALRAGAHEENLVVVMNGADLRRFSPQPPDSAEASAFGPQMVFACRQLFPRKGIRVLIEATAKLISKYPKLKLIIAGDGFERPALEKLSRELGIADRTTFLGWMPNKELPPYFRGCAVSVIPSLEEGFGIPAAEAMGCEAPVVATDAGGLPEVVADGVTGLIVPKGNADALAAAMDRLLGDPQLRQRMGKAGRQRALERFDWDRSVEKFELAYRKALSQAQS